MRRGTTVFAAGGLLLLAACIRTVVVPGPDRRDRGSRPPPRTAPEPERPAPPPPRPQARNEVLIPAGHLPDAGECRVWIPGRAPGRQPRPRSRSCVGIASLAPAGSWIVYRPTDDRRLVYLRVVDERRPGIVIRIRIFDTDSWELVREEEPQEEQRGGGERPREERPRDQRPPEQRPPLPPREIIRPVQPPPDSTAREQGQHDNKPPEQRPPDSRPPENKPPEDNRPDQRDDQSGAATLNIPPGHLPEIGECRVWIPGLPPGQQPRPKSRACDGITSVAPTGSWIIYRPSDDQGVVHVRILDERRAGVVIRIRVFDIESRRLVREENR